MEDEQRYCVFCCRELFSSGFSKENGRKNKLNTNPVSQFFRLFSRYCLTGLKISQCNEYRACDNCVVVLNDFTDLYSQMDGLRLKLNWRINTLKTIMEQADKIPSRQKAFGPVENINQRNDFNEDTRKLRNRFVHDCSTHLKSSWPKIKLSRHHVSSINSEMTIPFNLEQNQANPDMETEYVEPIKLKEISNAFTDNENETLKLNSDSSAVLERYKNFVEPENTVFSIITEEDEISVEENPPGNITQIDSESSIRSERLTVEDTIDAPVENDPTNSLNYSVNSISEPISDIIPNTSPCDQADDDLSHNFDDEDLISSQNIEYNTTTGEQCVGEENDVEIEDCASVSGVESNEMEIDDNEQMFPVCILEDQATNEDLSSLLTDNQNVIADLPDALHDNTTSEQCLTEENNVETEDCASAPRLKSNEMEIDDNEHIHPICELENEVHIEDLNYPLIDDQNVIPELPVALHDELVQNDVLPLKQKRSLRKIFQCKICKLTFSSSERLNFHNKSHEDDDSDNESDDSQHSTYSAINGSSSESESGEECNNVTGTNKNHYVQCSQCSIFFRKGNDINQHMKTVHRNDMIDKGDKASVNYDDENNASTLQSISKPTLLNGETRSVSNTTPLNLLETLLRLRFQCDLCQLTFSTAIRLEEHVKSHNDHDHSDNVENVSSVKHEDKLQSDISDDEQSNNTVSSNYSSESSYFDSETSSSENDENSESEMECKPSASHKPKAKEKQIIPRAKYQCEICKLRFATKVILQYHQRKHISVKTRAGTSKDQTNERNKFQCPHCPKRFHSQHRKFVHIWKRHTTHNTSPYFEDFVIMDNFTSVKMSNPFQVSKMHF